MLSDIATAVSIEKKIKEAILSFRIEKAYSKDYILELYLNEVYLGNRSYGIAAASLNYFNKSLQELTIGEAAFLAVLPKAPSRYHPYKKPSLTYARRNWVVNRMLINNFITEEEAQLASKEAISLHDRDLYSVINGNYFAEEVKREVTRNWGATSLYTNGYAIRTSLDVHLQAIAKKSLQNGLVAYDRKHGWRGPIATIKYHNINKDTLIENLKSLKLSNVGQDLDWMHAVVITICDSCLKIITINGSKGVIPIANLKWARKYINENTKGEKVTHPNQVANVGDVLLVKQVINKNSKGAEKQNLYQLCQVPQVSGAIVVMDQNTGKVLAIQGGFSFELSQFNRATQAERQTGSSFKPFAYLAALESGLSPSSILYDLPIAIDMGYGLGIWKPNNWDMKFLGPLTLRKSFELSRNVPAIRMIQESVGMQKVVNIATRFNIDKNMLPQLSGILGASETTLINMVSAYAMLANGGKFVEPSFIDRVQNRFGKTVLMGQYQMCDANALQDSSKLPVLKDIRHRVTDKASAYQITSILVGSVKRGLSRFLRGINGVVAAKSGTTNNYKDAWMIGYSADFVVGVFVGFDLPKSLGHNHYGTNVAGPIFRDFMQQALINKPVLPFKVPNSVKLIKININTGKRAGSEDKNAIYEAFKKNDKIPLIDNHSSDTDDTKLDIIY